MRRAASVAAGSKGDIWQQSKRGEGVGKLAAAEHAAQRLCVVFDVRDAGRNVAGYMYSAPLAPLSREGLSDALPCGLYSLFSLLLYRTPLSVSAILC